MNFTLSEIIIERLLGQRDFYLNTLKHLEFQALDDVSKNEAEDIERKQSESIDKLKKIEQEIAFLLSEESP